MSSASDVYTEFVDSNMDKRYPLIDVYAESGSGITIPSSFLVDLKLMIQTMDNPGDSSYRFNMFISEIIVYPDYVHVRISCPVDGVVTTVAESDPIPVRLNVGSSIEDRTIRIRPTTTFPVNGTLVVGTCSDIAKYPGAWDISEEQGSIFPANITIIPEGLTGLVVDGTVVSGDVILEAGDNIDISYDENTNTIKVSVIVSPNEAFDDSDLLALITEKYGPPVLSVNGVSPDVNGNITLTNEDCLEVRTIPEAHTITISNPCGNTCASETFMSDTYGRISDLNKNMTVLTSFYNSASNTLAQMGVRVASVLESKA